LQNTITGHIVSIGRLKAEAPSAQNFPYCEKTKRHPRHDKVYSYDFHPKIIAIKVIFFI